MPRPSALTGLALALLAAGCEPSSRLAPEEPTAELDAVERQQLCRFTTDLWEGRAPGCDGAGELSFEGCVASPPWLGCDAPPLVEGWEDCVVERVDDPCDAPACAASGCP